LTVKAGGCCGYWIAAAARTRRPHQRTTNRQLIVRRRWLRGVYRRVHVGQDSLLHSVRQGEDGDPFIGSHASQLGRLRTLSGNAQRRGAQPKIAFLHHNTMQLTTIRSITALRRSERLNWMQMAPTSHVHDAVSGCSGATLTKRLRRKSIHIDSLPSPTRSSLMHQQNFLRRRMRYDFP
jgi:hypothetical protein